MNSNLNLTYLVVQIITCILAGSAIYIYIKQRIDQKKDAAKLILQEIRYAGQQIETLKKFNAYSSLIKILPTNSWHKNIHLFVGKLKEHEIDLISQFYSGADYLDSFIKNVFSKRNEMSLDYSSEIKTPQDVEQIKKQKEGQIQQINANASPLIVDISQKIGLIYNTPVVYKLEGLSEKRRFFIF